MNKVVRCSKCILPASYPGISFDDDGICDFCSSQATKDDKTAGQSKKELDRIVEAYRGKSRKYDAIVGLSGGKDSSYVAYYLKMAYGLKLLGINYDIGYRSKYALQNLEILADKLAIDLITIRPKKSFLMGLFAHFMRAKGEFCSVCNNLGYLIGASFSAKESRSLGFSPLMVGGWSKKYEFQPGVSVTSMEYFFKHLSQELLDELMAQPFIEKEAVRSFMKVKDPRQAQLGTDDHKKLGAQAMHFIQLPDYIEWNIGEIPGILSRELGWRHPEDVHESHFDCTLFPIKEYLKFRKYGLTQETIKNSVLIREGRMTREEALKRISFEQTTQPAVLARFLEEMGLLADDVNWEGEWSR